MTLNAISPVRLGSVACGDRASPMRPIPQRSRCPSGCSPSTRSRSSRIPTRPSSTTRSCSRFPIARRNSRWRVSTILSMHPTGVRTITFPCPRSWRAAANLRSWPAPSATHRPGRDARKIPRWRDCPRRTSRNNCSTSSSGKRKPTGPEAYLPNQHMLKIAKAMTDAGDRREREVLCATEAAAARVRRSRACAYRVRNARRGSTKKFAAPKISRIGCSRSPTNSCDTNAATIAWNTWPMCPRQHLAWQAPGGHGRWWQDSALLHLPSRESQGYRQGSADRGPLAYLPAAADAGIPQRRPRGRSRAADEARG